MILIEAFDITEYKQSIQTEAETSLPDGLRLKENKLTGSLSELNIHDNN